MTAPDLLDIRDLVGDARDIAELIMMAHRAAPLDSEAKAVNAAAYRIVGILEEVGAGLEAIHRHDAPAPAEIVQAMDRARLPATAIADLFKGWLKTRDAVNASDGEDAALIESLSQIETAMMAQPALTPADLAMQLYAFSSGEVLHLCGASMPLAAQIERLTGEKCK